ncbi:hypothetical protein CLU79DRAFT_30369 [Phycomyces nitens]|nr:hypothetical protein CLU79DRAFT_30369 [Phycomyces nitens]
MHYIAIYLTLSHTLDFTANTALDFALNFTLYLVSNLAGIQLFGSVTCNYIDGEYSYFFESAF